jgi:hypothetical protein
MTGISPRHYKTGELKSLLLGEGLAQTSVYQIYITTPPAADLIFFKDFNLSEKSRFNLLCCDAVLPGTSLATHEVTNDYSGVTEKMAYRRIYDDSLDLTFYVDNKYKVISYFDRWMDYITGKGTTFASNIYENPNAYYRMNYPNLYRSNISVTKFEKDNSKSLQPTLTYNFIGAFPTNIISIPISYNSSDLLKCTVSFTYMRYVRKDQFSLNSSYTPPSNPATQASVNSTGNPELRVSNPGTQPERYSLGSFSASTPDPLTNSQDRVV